MRLFATFAVLVCALGSAFADGAPARSPDAPPELAQVIDKYFHARAAACTKPRRRPYEPSTVAAAEARKAAGKRWRNGVIRRYYKCLGAAIRRSARAWKRQGKPAEVRARLAYAIRRRARLVARAMMQDASEVAALRARDEMKYGNPYGPTFDRVV